MKKLLLSLCAASLLAASAVGFAGEVTFVNQFSQPVNFVVSQGGHSSSQALAEGLVFPGQSGTVYFSGSFTPDTFIAAYSHGIPVGSNCGRSLSYFDIGKVVAFPSPNSDRSFECRTFHIIPPVQQMGGQRVCHTYWSHHHKYTTCRTATAY